MVTAISSSRCLSCLGAARRHLSPKHRELALQVLRLCGSIQLLLLVFWIQDWWIQFPFEIFFRLILVSCDLMICVQSCGMFCVCLCRVCLEFRRFLLLLVMRFVVMRFVCTVKYFRGGEILFFRSSGERLLASIWWHWKPCVDLWTVFSTGRF